MPSRSLTYPLKNKWLENENSFCQGLFSGAILVLGRVSYLAKLYYFTNLDFPEIEDFPY